MDLDSLNMSLGVIIFLVALALAFDFMNGFHDAANAIATVVSTRVLKPHHAVMMATFFNFVAIFVFHLTVAATIGKGTIEPSVVDHYVVFGALVGAIAWNVVTWYYGIPSSSSHALVGGLIGAALVKSGPDALISSGVIKIVSFILISPLIGMLLGGLMMLLLAWLFRKQTPHRVDSWSRRLSLVSASAYALGHGGNHAGELDVAAFQGGIESLRLEMDGAQAAEAEGQKDGDQRGRSPPPSPLPARAPSRAASHAPWHWRRA